MPVGRLSLPAGRAVTARNSHLLCSVIGGQYGTTPALAIYPSNPPQAAQRDTVRRARWVPSPPRDTPSGTISRELLTRRN